MTENMDAVGKKWLKFRDESREEQKNKVRWAVEGEVLQVKFGEFEPDPTKRKNENTGKEYQTDDWVVTCIDENGEEIKRKIHVTKLDAIITKAKELGKLKDGEIIEFQMPYREDEGRGGRGGRGGRDRFRRR